MEDVQSPVSELALDLYRWPQTSDSHCWNRSSFRWKPWDRCSPHGEAASWTNKASPVGWCQIRQDPMIQCISAMDPTPKCLVMEMDGVRYSTVFCLYSCTDLSLSYLEVSMFKNHIMYNYVYSKTTMVKLYAYITSLIRSCMIVSYRIEFVKQ